MTRLFQGQLSASAFPGTAAIGSEDQVTTSDIIGIEAAGQDDTSNRLLLYWL